MRNLFDQYHQPENRLTHALGVCLDEDRGLLRRFLAWLGVRPPAPVRTLLVDGQRLPGEDESAEEEAERRGLPDLVIHDGDRWALIVESKVQAPLSSGQLGRHVITLRRRGFDRASVLCLTKRGMPPPRGALGRTWSEVYQWLGPRATPGSWAGRLRAYLRAAETRLAEEAYMTEGTLTMFDGFRFGPRNPYTYAEAKRLLKLAREQLARDPRLQRLGLDPRGRGRGAITASEDLVWDVLPLRQTRGSRSFTAAPHLTLGVHRNEVSAAVTIPNAVSPVLRRSLAALGPDGLGQLHRQILRRARPLVQRGAVVRAYAVQRHFPSRRGTAIEDARLRFTLHAVVRAAGGQARYDSRWAALFADLLARKRGNVQFGYAVALPHGMRGLASRTSLDLLVRAWWSMEPLLRVLRGGPGTLR